MTVRGMALRKSARGGSFAAMSAGIVVIGSKIITDAMPSSTNRATYTRLYINHVAVEDLVNSSPYVHATDRPHKAPATIIGISSGFGRITLPSHLPTAHKLQGVARLGKPSGAGRVVSGSVRLRVQQELAVRSAILEQTMRFRGFAQGQCVPDVNAEMALAHQLEELIPSLGEVLWWMGRQAKAAHPQGSSIEFVRVHRVRGAACIPEEDELAVKSQEGEALGLGSAPDGIEDRVHGWGAPDGVDARGQVWAVGEGDGAHPADQFQLAGGGCGAEDLDAAPTEQLDEEKADATGGGMDEGALAGRQGSGVMGEAVRREALDRQRCGDVERDGFRNSEEGVHRSDRVVGVGAGGLEGPEGNARPKP